MYYILTIVFPEKLLMIAHSLTRRERFRAVFRDEFSDRVPMVCRLDIGQRGRRHYGGMSAEVAGDSLEQFRLKPTRERQYCSRAL